MPASPSSPSLPSQLVSIASLVPLPALTQALGDPLRWAILGELATGEKLMVVEIARALKKPATLVSKHLAVIRKAGVLAMKQRLHFIPAHFLPEPGKRIIDFGHCLLRFDAEQA